MGWNNTFSMFSLVGYEVGLMYPTDHDFNIFTFHSFFSISINISKYPEKNWTKFAHFGDG